ncbi:hypothetical protein EYF80_010121 [Liparis tanakae]|uniref:Uncharacterized protein n=1 Tax=Liparis tanakae TaxID=230148 RepID=A0A4Z2INE1_9TELE|nr:hypothetical protein EYF80_010121 [Liparis tanakae]
MGSKPGGTESVLCKGRKDAQRMNRWLQRTGLKDTGDRAPGFFLTARICSKALKAGRTNTGSH